MLAGNLEAFAKGPILNQPALVLSPSVGANILNIGCTGSRPVAVKRQAQH